jgi:hypothetical protein
MCWGTFLCSSLSFNYICKTWKRRKSSTPSNRKRRFIRTENEEINILTLQYYLKMKEMEVNVTGSMLQRKAREVAQQLGKTEFKASNGWLESFRKRHKIGLASCF